MNFPPQRRQPRPQQQNPNQFAPANVLMALLDQSRKRYAAIAAMIQNEDQGFRQLDLDCSTMAQIMMDNGGQANPDLHRLAEQLQETKRAGMMARVNLEGQLECEKFLQGQIVRWLQGKRAVQMAVTATQAGQGGGGAPAPQMNGASPMPQLQQGPVPQQAAPQNGNPYASPAFQQHAPGQVPPQAPAPYPQQQQVAPQGQPAYMFGPFPGQANVPFQPAPVESLPVTQLPVQHVPIDQGQLQPQVMPPPIPAQQYASPEAARAAIPGPPPPVVAQPPVVQFINPEAAKAAVEQSHANNIPASGVPQANGSSPKPIASS